MKKCMYLYNNIYTNQLNCICFTAEEIHKFSDLLYSDLLVPEQVKFHILLTEEDKMKEAVNGLERIEAHKSVLDSQPLQGLKIPFCYHYFTYCLLHKKG